MHRWSFHQTPGFLQLFRQASLRFVQEDAFWSHEFFQLAPSSYAQDSCLVRRWRFDGLDPYATSARKQARVLLHETQSFFDHPLIGDVFSRVQASLSSQLLLSPSYQLLF